MTVWSSYQGIEVVESDSTVKYRHPRLSVTDPRLTPLEGATLLALVDGTFLVVCDTEDCGFNGITGKEPYVKPEGEQRSIVDQAGSLFSHINGAHRTSGPRRSPTKPVPTPPPTTTSSRYNPAQIKVAIKIWLKWKATGIKHWTQSACDELERLGFEPSFAEKWNPDQLGSLVRQYIQRDQYKNIKAGPMDEADREVLAEMVREAAERAGNGRKTTVAANVRITTKPARKPPWHANLEPDGGVESNNDAAPVEQQEETAVVTSDSPNPTLSFTGPGGNALPESPARTMVLDAGDVATHTMKPAASRAHPPVVLPQESDFELVIELPGGEPLFKYKGELMVGKLAKVSVQG